MLRPTAIAPEGLLVGVDDDEPGVTVDDDRLATADYACDVLEPDDRRELHGTSHDRRVRRAPADVDRESLDALLVERGGLARREIVRDQHEALIFVVRPARGVRILLAQEVAKHLPFDIGQVMSALGDVRRTHRLEPLVVLENDAGQRVLDGILLRTDPLYDLLAQSGITDHVAMRGKHLTRDVEILVEPFDVTVDLGGDGLDRAIEPVDLGIDTEPCDEAAVNTEILLVKHDGFRDRDSG